jgi:hypothetical protein
LVFNEQCAYVLGHAHEHARARENCGNCLDPLIYHGMRGCTQTAGCICTRQVAAVPCPGCAGTGYRGNGRSMSTCPVCQGSLVQAAPN